MLRLLETECAAQWSPSTGDDKAAEMTITTENLRAYLKSVLKNDAGKYPNMGNSCKGDQ